MSAVLISNHPETIWMRGRGFDLAFFHLSGLASLLLILPYVFFGDTVIFPIYNFYLVFFGLPHNYLTWATLLPNSARKTFNMEPIYTSAIVCLIVTFLIPLTSGTTLNDWILSFISYYSLWHAYRQHHGICKVYDAIQARRTGDNSIFSDRKAMNLFFGLAANSILIWAFTHPQIRYLLSADEFYNLIYPQVPEHIFQIYVFATCMVGLWAFKRAVWDRWSNNKFVPWPQISLMVVAIATYIIPYCFIDLRAMPLAVAIGTIYHNIQYFGFVWLFEKHRSDEMAEANIPLQLPQRLSYTRSWKMYFSIAITYSFVIVAIYKLLPHQAGMALIYFLGIAHYIIDGYIWRKDVNKLLNPVIGRLAFSKKTPLYKTA